MLRTSGRRLLRLVASSLLRHVLHPEVLAHSFKLSGVQQLVARQHVFESWQALKARLSTMADHSEQNLTKAVIIAVEPALFVAEIKASLEFFTQKLRFSTKLNSTLGGCGGSQPS